MLDSSYTTLQPDERVTEAHRILEMFGIGALNIDELEPKERQFVEDITDCKTCSPAQLIWLRSIKDKYL